MGDRAGHVPTNYVPPLANSINAQLFTVPLPLFTFLGYASSAFFRPFRLFQREKFKKEKKRFTLIFLFHLFSSAAKPKFAYVFNSCQGKTFPKVSALQRGQVINFNQFDFQRLGKLLGSYLRGFGGLEKHSVHAASPFVIFSHRKEKTKPHKSL